VFRVLLLNCVPLASLLCVPSILRLKPAHRELIQCCIASAHFDVIQNFGFISIYPRIAICRSTLIISCTVQPGTIFEVHDFIRLLTGKVRFPICHTSDGADCAAYHRIPPGAPLASSRSGRPSTSAYMAPSRSRRRHWARISWSSNYISHHSISDQSGRQGGLTGPVGTNTHVSLPRGEDGAVPTRKYLIRRLL
jgi:hypothetical protein